MGTGSHGDTIDTRHVLDSPAYVAYEHTSPKSRPQGVQFPTSAVVISENETSVHHKRAGVPFLPGNLFCPAIGSDILDSAGTKICQIYASLNLEGGDTDQIVDVLSRREEDINVPLVTESEDTFSPFEISTMKTCPKKTVPIPGFSNTQVQAYFDLAFPHQLNAQYNRRVTAPCRVYSLMFCRL